MICLSTRNEKRKIVDKGGFHMNKEKLKIIRNSADEYKKLPEDKQMFILGFMQGVLSSQKEKEIREAKCNQQSVSS